MPIISTRDLSKRYRLGAFNARSLRDEAELLMARLRGRRAVCRDPKEFWAIRDVSFDVDAGEIVGIIGRNGAGKSTLLKILSRITEPTAGEVRIRGRVASLLEVGTGFHPELSGRDNVFLNGAILGMTKREIRDRFDEIVDFSGIEKFIDTPVKRYSSGMYVRLAFAVAAHLDPEILIVDEVLAVGDADFQKRCLGKLHSLHDTGRTVLIVSHQMSMITGLCGRGIVLSQGSVDFDGPVTDAVHHYQTGGGEAAGPMLDADALGRVIGNDFARLHRAWLADAAGNPRGAFDLEDDIVIHMEYSVLQPGKLQTYPNFHFFDQTGAYFFVTAGIDVQNKDVINRRGRWHASCTVPGNLLNTGSFTAGIAVTTMNPGIEVAFFERDALTFQVTEDIQGTLDTKRMGYAGPMPGTLRPKLQWTVDEVPARESVNT